MAKTTTKKKTVQRRRVRVRYGYKPSPEAVLEDLARETARTIAYEYLREFISKGSGTLDQRIEVARILIGGTY